MALMNDDFPEPVNPVTRKCSSTFFHASSWPLYMSPMPSTPRAATNCLASSNDLCSVGLCDDCLEEDLPMIRVGMGMFYRNDKSANKAFEKYVITTNLARIMKIKSI